MLKKSKTSKDKKQAKVKGEQLSDSELDKVAGGLGLIAPLTNTSQPVLKTSLNPVRVGGSGIDTLTAGFKKGGGLASENGCCAIERLGG